MSGFNLFDWSETAPATDTQLEYRVIGARTPAFSMGFSGTCAQGYLGARCPGATVPEPPSLTASTAGAKLALGSALDRSNPLI